MTSSLCTVGRSSRGTSLAVHALALTAGLACVGPAAAQGLVVVPSVALTETLTNNRDLSATDRRADLITQISPGISLSSGRGALQGNLSYVLNGLAYARESSLNSVYHSLVGTGRLTLLDGRAGVDLSANAGRQIISAFGTQSTSPLLNTGNQAQVFSYSIAPYLQGRLLGDVGYRMRVGYTASRSNAGALGDSQGVDAAVGLNGRISTLGWAIDGNQSSTTAGDRPRAHNARLMTSLTYSPDVELQLTARIGTETEDIRSGDSQRSTVWGAGLAWQPGPRTTVRADYDRRYFGNSHTVNLSHRMARTIWTASDSRSVQTGGITGRGVTSRYEQLFAQNATVEPDPVKRDILVRNILAASGLDGNEQVVVGGFLNGTPSVQRTRSASLAYQGLRDTFVISYVRTASSSLVLAPVAEDDLQSGDVVRQHGLSMSFSHRLTPESSIVITASQQRTAGAGTQSGNDLKSIIATWSARLGLYANWSLGVRRSQFDSETNPYQESAVIGTIRMQF